MATAPQRFSEFLVFLESILTEEMRSIMPLVIKRYNACSRPFKNSQDMLHLLTTTKHDMECDQRHMFIYLKDFLSELSAYQEREKLATKRKHESDSSDAESQSGKESEKSDSKRCKTNSLTVPNESANSGKKLDKSDSKRVITNSVNNSIKVTNDSANSDDDDGKPSGKKCNTNSMATAKETPGSSIVRTNCTTENKSSAGYVGGISSASSAPSTAGSKPVKKNGWIGSKDVCHGNVISQTTCVETQEHDEYVCLSSSDEDTTRSKNNNVNSKISSTSKSDVMHTESTTSEQLPSIKTPFKPRSDGVLDGKRTDTVLDGQVTGSTGAESQVQQGKKNSQTVLEGKTCHESLDEKVITGKELLKKKPSDVCSTPSSVDSQAVNSSLEPATSVSKHKEISEKHIRRLEKLLTKLRNEIEKAREKELSLDDLDAEDSSYIYEDKLEKKFVAVWNKLCEAKKRKPSTGRPTERRFTYSGSRYPEVNRQIERFINKKKIFPDYFDIRKILFKVNKEKSLKLSTSAIASLSRETFIEVGNILQKRRHEDFVCTFRCKQTEGFRIDKDPALFDKELKRKLDENSQKGKEKLAEVINKYVDLQYKTPDTAADKESSDEQTSQPSDDNDNNIDQISLDELSDEELSTDKIQSVSNINPPNIIQPRRVTCGGEDVVDKERQAVYKRRFSSDLNRNVGDEIEEESSVGPKLPEAIQPTEITLDKSSVYLSLSDEETTAENKETEHCLPVCDAVKPKEVTCKKTKAYLSVSDDEEDLSVSAEIPAKVDNEEYDTLTIQPRSTNPLIWPQPKRVDFVRAVFVENKDEPNVTIENDVSENKCPSAMKAVDLRKTGGATESLTINGKTSSSSDVVEITDDENDIKLTSAVTCDIVDLPCKDNESDFNFKTLENQVSDKTEMEQNEVCSDDGFLPSVNTVMSDEVSIVEIKDDSSDEDDVGGNYNDDDNTSEISKKNAVVNSQFHKEDTTEITKNNTMETSSHREPEHISGTPNTTVDLTHDLSTDTPHSAKATCHTTTSSGNCNRDSPASTLSSRIVTLMDKRIQLHVPEHLLKKRTKNESEKATEIDSNCQAADVKSEPLNNRSDSTEVDEVSSSNIPADDDVILLSSGHMEDSDDDIIILSD